MKANSKFRSTAAVPELEDVSMEAYFFGKTGVRLTIESSEPHPKGGFKHQSLNVQMSFREAVELQKKIAGSLIHALEYYQRFAAKEIAHEDASNAR